MPHRSPARKRGRARRAALALVVAACACVSVAGAADDPNVDVFVHVPLVVPHALPGTRGPWYCAPGRRHVDAPIAPALLASYERTLGRAGTVIDHVGYGTWTLGADPAAAVVFERNDHIEIQTRWSTARALVPAFLRRLRADTQQRETLAEIVGIATAPIGEARTKISVLLPPARAKHATVLELHEIFGDRGAGGASQYADGRGVRVYSGTTPAATPRIEAALRRAGITYTTEPELFVTVDAPPC